MLKSKRTDFSKSLAVISTRYSSLNMFNDFICKMLNIKKNIFISINFSNIRRNYIFINFMSTSGSK